MRFEFLGHVVVRGTAQDANVRGDQPALVLARIVLERPAPLTRDELAELLWPVDRPREWEGPARQVVSRARAALVAAGCPSNALVSRGGRTALRLDSIEVDVEDALAAVTTAEAAVDPSGHALATALTAVELLRRPFFALSESEWVTRWQERLRAHLLRALHAASGAALAAGNPARAIELADEAFVLDPYDEIATRALMAAYDASGSRAQALAAYERCRRLLDDELGVRPAEETEAAYVELLGAPPREHVVTTPVNSLPAPTRVLPFVGRHAERDRVDRAWEETVAGDARAIVIAGEAGIGKTRLATYAADIARDHGSLVLWGSCVADVGLPYQPFTDLLAQLIAARPGVLDDIGPLAPDLAALVPELGTGDARARPDEKMMRTRLFRAVDAVFAAVHEPLVIVIDDLQWAGDDALALLRNAAVSLPGHPRLIVITARDGGSASHAALADVQRRFPTTELVLRGLSIADLGELLEQSGLLLGADTRAVASQLAARTTGNPFFVTQLVLDAGAAGAPFDPTAVPDAIAVFVERRLDALDREAAAAVSLAAVAGDSVDVETLEACSPSEPDELLGLLEDLCEQRFLEERVAGQFRFVHALVRDAVLATIGGTRRQRLHRRLADTLARRNGDPAVVAHHYVEAGPSCAAEATRWLLEAGCAALSSSAWAVAADQFELALALAVDIDQRCSAAVGMGRARRAMGDSAAGRAAVEEALDLARAYGRGRAAAEAALALVGGGGRGVAVDLPDSERTAILRSALDGLGSDDIDLLVPTLGELALSLVLTDAKDERDAIAERCVAEARRTDDPDLLAGALQSRRIALMGPDGTEGRVADALEVLAFPREFVTPERRLAAHLSLVEDLIEMGDRRGVDDALAAATELARTLAHPYWSWATTSWQALVAIVDGRLDEAEALAFGALGHQSPAEHPEAMAALGVNLTDIRLFQGRSAEMIELLRDAADSNPQIPCYRAVLALCCMDAGDETGAREAYAYFSATEFEIPPDSNWLLTVAVLADVAATLGDVTGSRILSDALAPYANRHVVLNCFGGGGAYWGPVAHHLGRCAAVLGAPDQASDLLDRARESARSFGANGFLARTEKTRTV